MELKEYKKHLEKEAIKFRLTSEDISNSFDLGMMIPHWFYEGVLKPNKMNKWFDKFFFRIEKVANPKVI